MTDRRTFLKGIGFGGVAVVAAGASARALFASPDSGDDERSDPPETEETPPAPSETEETPSSEEGRRIRQSSSDKIGVGVYLGDESVLAPWEEWFGRTVDYYSMNVPRNDWSDYRIANMPLEVPIEEIAADRKLVVTFTMFPPGETTMEAVASGEHTDRYRRLGRDFVERGMTDVNFRFGAEMNGEWSSDGAVGRPDLYVRAWKQTVEALDSVDGSGFEYIWAPTLGEKQLDPLQAYPGDDFVDQIGLTFYDSGWRNYPFPEQCGTECVFERRKQTWQRLVTQNYGLDDWAGVARDHDIPLVFPEYGIRSQTDDLHGGGDNPHFFRWFDEWMKQNADTVGWHGVWSWVGGPQFIGPERLLQTDEYPPHPRASRAFRRLYGRPDPS